VECPKCATVLGRKSRQAARKRLMFGRLPRVLVVRLQRNAFDPARGLPYKNTAHVHCPPGLDLSDFYFFNVLAVEDSVVHETFQMLNGHVPNTMDPPSFLQTPAKRSPGATASSFKRMHAISPISPLTNPSQSYHLVAVVEHTGSAFGGHFITYRRLSGDAWVKCNDEAVSVVSSDVVAQAAVYLSVYEADE
jgi:ubiquitin C-terminal hydrolase